MRLFIDCEWNDGDLISVALVDEVWRAWYASLGCEKPNEWVAANVMPKVGIPSISLAEMQRQLAEFLSVYITVHIVADWPEDIAQFCNLLITGPGKRIDTPPLTLEVLRDLGDAESQNPHNALSDAYAIAELWHGRHRQPERMQ